MRRPVRRNAIDPAESAKAAGLRYVSEPRTAGIRRIGRRAPFRYVDPAGRTVTDRATLDRIRALAIPPAWTGVWICPDPRGHLQATGRDARRRKQYRYHARWRHVRDEVKYGRMVAFARALPAIRRRTEIELKKPGLSREKVLAAVVQLLEKTLIRVGNEEYARDNHSFGLTTLRDQHAKIAHGELHFEFRGKSGIRHAVSLHDARLTRIVKACRDLPGFELFQYVDAEGRRQAVGSADVNAYVRTIAGEDFTAKDFRTWAGTVLAAQALARAAGFTSAAQAKRNILQAVDQVATCLGNTRAVCRKSYIHPAILDAYLDGAMSARSRDLHRIPARQGATSRALSAAEAAVVALIERRLRKTA
jgi:DNA topoisomerase I